MDVRRIKGLVGACRSLESFTFVGDDEAPSAGHPQFTPGEIPSILESHTETLKALYYAPTRIPDTTADLYRVPSLAGFSQLTDLTIKEFSMPPVPELPASLTKLVLLFCSIGVFPTLRSLTEACRTSLPFLRIVQVQCSAGTDDDELFDNRSVPLINSEFTVNMLSGLVGAGVGCKEGGRARHRHPLEDRWQTVLAIYSGLIQLEVLLIPIRFDASAGSVVS
ncbi:hypothetical protein FE257_003849 [Aspergillus nanangensis]|uniref:Uncharacterized protein n=1 Tax=Aspergillus nanangensis TaxID=2582783 RepID=A0AAD4CBG3_ASPNN|nr:hypothetical protein FE257_003849 [Aspergillus nanangensis]